MASALAQAALAPAHGDVPIGAVVVAPSGDVVAAGHNERELTGDPTAHAEVLALRRAAEAVGSWHLDGHTLVVTLEPCTMCAGALVLARVERVVIGAWDPKAGAVSSLFGMSDSFRFLRASRAGGSAISTIFVDKSVQNPFGLWGFPENP